MSKNSENEVNEWESCKSFEDMILMNLKYINDDTTKHPIYAPNPFGGKNLNHESYEIKDYLVELNKLGFLSTVSQPSYIEELEKEIRKNNRSHIQYGIC